MNQILTAALFISGAIIFVVGVSMPSLQKAWAASLDVYLQTLAANGRSWRLANLCFMAAVVLNGAGFALFANQLQAEGDRGWALLGMLGFGVAMALWLVHQSYRLSMHVWAAGEYGRSGQIPMLVKPMMAFTAFLFNTYMIISYAATACFGTAILSGGLLPNWLGWLAVVFPVAGIVSISLGQPKISGFPPLEMPVLVHLLPLMMGIVMLGQS